MYIRKNSNKSHKYHPRANCANSMIDYEESDCQFEKYIAYIPNPNSEVIPNVNVQNQNLKSGLNSSPLG